MGRARYEKNPLRDPRRDAGAARRVAGWVFAWLPTATVALLALPHLWHPLWHDEFYTHFVFARSPQAALTDYAPNNHILFSLEWWAFTRVVENPALWRLFPFAHLLAAAWVMTRAGARWTGGARGGWLTGMVFATMHPVLSFGVELRGYAPSLLYVAAALYALARWREKPARRWLALYAGMAFLAVGTVPVNLAAFAPLAAWMAWRALRRSQGRSVPNTPPMTPPSTSEETKTPAAGAKAEEEKRRADWAAAWWCALAPFSGLAMLWPVRGQILGQVGAGSSMSKLTFLWHFPYAALVDGLWLPLLSWVLYALARRARREDSTMADVRGVACAGNLAVGEAVWFTFLCVMVPVGCALVLPRTPNDYSFVAALPGVALGLGWTTEALWRRLSGVLAPRGMEALALCAAMVAVGAGSYRESTAGDWRRHGAPAPSPWLVDADGNDIALYNLRRQRFQDNHNQINLVDEIARRLDADGTPRVFVLAEGGDLYPLIAYWRWRAAGRFLESRMWAYWPGNELAPAERWREAWDRSARRFFVLSGEASASEELLATLFAAGRDRGYLGELYRNGEYTLYEWVSTPRAAEWSRRTGRAARPLASPAAE